MSIIFIAGLTRSGTTFLQSQLLRYDNVVALGEVLPTIKAIKNVDAKPAKWKVKLGLKSESYWKPETYHILLERVKKDSFWASIEDEIKASDSVKSAVELVYRKANEKYPGHVIIDSSKSIGSLQTVMQIDTIKSNIKVILCIRDYRGWLYSVKKHQKRTSIHQRNNIIEIYKWMYSNKKLLDYLSANLKKNYKIISYDKLVFSFDKTMKAIVSFSGLGSLSKEENKDKFHEILGSQSLKKDMDANSIKYDTEWFSYTASAFEKPVSAFNKKIYLQLTNEAD